ncbi:MAG: response regulator [Gemmatimonadetes bacterium]|nr:response regulator [Gemmatimonadota bacterium]
MGILREPKVFVVDDDVSVRVAVGRLIRSAGLEVETFASAEDLLEAWPSDASGCLIVDVQMPGLSGLELQTELAALGSTVPIIFITAHDDPNARSRALNGGAADFLEKPFDDEELIAAIHAAFEADT